MLTLPLLHIFLSTAVSALLLTRSSPYFSASSIQTFDFPSTSLSSPYSDAVNFTGVTGNATTTSVKSDGSTLFWWFMTKQGGDVYTDSIPIVIWLQGGPGCSSLLGSFFEFGPLYVTEEIELAQRSGSWLEKYHLLLIDSPFGAGFSFTTSAGNYVTNEYQVGMYVYELLQRLSALHPEYFTHDFYLFGQSYGGKYVPAVAHFILNWNANATETRNAFVPLRGIGIGDGITDPGLQLTTFSDYAFAAALIDEKERETVAMYERNVVLSIAREQWIAAWNYTNDLIHYIAQQSGNMNVYNFRLFGQYNFTPIQTYFSQPWVGKSLNVPENVTFAACSQEAFNALEEDIAQSLVWMMPYLLNNTRVLIYNGQDDTFINTIGFENWISAIPWYGQSRFQQAEKTTWHVDSEVAGYAKTYANLTQVNVLDSGHMVPRDQLQRSLDMLTRFIENLQWD